MHGNSLTEQFKQGLLQLDMIDPQDTGASGLVFKGHPIHDRHEYIVMEKALEKYDVDAVYFRRFEDGRSSIPQVYIYDYTRFEKDENEIGLLHRRLWNSGQVPLFFIFTRTEIKIFNCLSSPKIEGDKFISSPFQVIALAAEVEDRLNEKNRKEFSARKFDNGSFWDTSEYKDVFSMENSSYETLLKHLKIIRNNIIKEKILEPTVVNKILVMSILVKYLEERVDKDGNTVFPRDFFQGFAEGAKNFAGILRKKGACLELFEYLSRHFNGEIFKWDETEKHTLAQTDLTRLSHFLEARSDIATGQGTLWRLYSFNDLPIELISNIYEEFLGNEKGVVYTPPYLVHFLIDEAMPLDCPAEDFKVLDPACGSGVFLVAAYKRIIDWWRIRHNWENPGLDKLKELLKNNIFGVDIFPDAVRMTIFSLSLVLLDALSPKEIWEDLKFDNLKHNGNLFEQDFFEVIEHYKIKKELDLVIGNPPFIAIDTPSARNIEEKQKKIRPPIPDRQLALLFFEQSLAVCKPGGLNCLILPAEPFLYNYGSDKIRKYFLETFNIKQVLDFTPLREILFGSANAAVSVVFAKKEEPDLKPVLHAIFRRTKASKEKFYFELDHYDLHPVSYQDAMNCPFIWKANLLGGGRLRHLISRLSKLRKLGSYIKEKMKKEGWIFAEGFIVGNKSKINRLKELSLKDALPAHEAEELKRLQKQYQRADYLTGKRTLPAEALTEDGIDETQFHLSEEEFFYRKSKKNKLIFKGPHLLIREIATGNSIPIGFSDDDFSFKDSVVGIHAPVNQREELIAIEKNLKGNSVSSFCAIAFSGKHMIKRGAAIQKKDIENIPYPEDWTELELSDIEKILVKDTLEYMPDFREKGENSVLLKPVDTDQLNLFGDTFCKILNTVYDKFKPHQPMETDNYICFPIYYDQKPQLEADAPGKLENHLNKLVYKEFQKHLRVVRVLRIYDKNVIFLVKPKQLRYWLRSIAVRDADETFEDLVKQGY